jgi:hypothetical protein
MRPTLPLLTALLLAPLAALQAADTNTPPGDRNLSINQVYPPESFYHNGKGGRVLDVTKPPFNAKGDGKTDDTKALRAAMRFVADNLEPLQGEGYSYCCPKFDKSWVIYLPNGEYLVSDTVQQGWPEKVWNIKEGWNNVKHFSVNSSEEAVQRKAEVYAAENWFIRVVGQNRTKTVIRLKDACPGFGSGQTKPVVSFCLTFFSNVNQGNYLENLTVDTGRGNPGAAALRWNAANWGGIRNARLRSGDGQGKVGLLLNLGCAHGYLRDLDIDGFETGIDMAAGYVNMVVIEHATLRNQTRVGLRVGRPFNRECLAARKLKFENVPLAAKADKGSHLVLVECVAKASGDAREALAVAKDGHLYVRAFESVGFQSAVLKEGAAPLPAGMLAEYVSDDSGTTEAGTQPRSLGLAVRDIPVFLPETDLAKWADVQTYGARGDGLTDDTVAIQRAMNSGKPVVFFSRATYVVNGSVAIPASVREVNFLHGTVYRSEVNPTTAMFRVAEPSTQPLLIHQNMNLGGIFVDHEADRPLVLEDLATWFHHTRGFAGKPGMLLPGKAAQGKDVWQLYRNTRPDGAPKEVYGANILGFAAGDVEGHAAVENVKAWLRQCNNEHTPGPMWAFRRSNVWMFGFKVEGAQQLFQVEEGSRLEVLGGNYDNFHSTTTPMFRAQDSEVSAQFIAATKPKAEFWPQALEGTRKGEAIFVPFRFAPLGVRDNAFIVSFGSRTTR